MAVKLYTPHVSPKQCDLHANTVTVRNCTWHMAVSLYTSLCHPNNATCTQTPSLSETASDTWLSVFTHPCVTQTMRPAHKHCHCQKLHWHMVESLHLPGLCHPNNVNCTQTLSLSDTTTDTWLLVLAFTLSDTTTNTLIVLHRSAWLVVPLLVCY